ncbi:hypothetical protein [Lactococcus lactis]|uniref:hypothetical protein n=1 Tax=Lactococcus lactis TaxID=1358 RepID=UPI001897FC87|nr:hypothetical protein [Lactococcus lactis]
MKYYVKVILENGLISQDIDVFSTMEEAKMFKNLSEKAGNKAEIYEIELIPAELEKLHEYKIVSKLSVEKLQEQQHELRILRDENRRLRNTLEMDRKDCDRYRSALVEIINLSSLSPTINDIARKAVFNTGTTGCPAGPEGVNGLTKEEIEGSGDE